jgi:hypothetical protein
MSQIHFTGKSLMTYNDQIFSKLLFTTDFKCSVHAQTIFNLLKNLETEKVKVELHENRLKINTAGVAAKLVVGEGTEINDILSSIEKEVENQRHTDSLPDDFLKAVELCAFSAFTKDIGGSFTCINVVDNYVMSTDRVRFSLYKMDRPMQPIMFKAQAAYDMIKYDLKFYSVSKSWIHFIDKDSLVFSVRKYSGEYPADEILAIVNKSTPVAKIVMPEEIMKALSFLNLFTEGQEQKHAQVTVKDGYMTIGVQGTKGAITKRVKVETTKEFDFGINPTLMGEILKRGLKTIEVAESVGKKEVPLAFFKTKNFTHAIVLFGQER